MFGLGDSRDNDRNEGTKAVDGGVAVWARGVSRSEVVDPPGDAFSVWAEQERSTRVCSKVHVGRMVDEVSEGVLSSATTHVRRAHFMCEVRHAPVIASRKPT
jgi:hypothetical protein